jgi:hypothetical protein
MSLGAGLAVAGIAGLAGAGIAGGAAGRAGDKANAAAMYQADAQLKAAREEAARQEPWRQVGLRALPKLEGYAPMSMDGWEQDPYNLAMLEAGQRGALGLQGNASARGMLNSGNTLRALVDYGKQNAGDRYRDIYEMRNQQNTQGYNRLASLANIGQTTDSNISRNNLSAQQNAGNLMMQGAATQAQAGIAQGQIYGQALGNLGNLGGAYLAGRSPWGGGNVWGGGADPAMGHNPFYS